MIAVTSSNDHLFSDIDTLQIPVEKVLINYDEDTIFRIPSCENEELFLEAFSAVLSDIGLDVSTGPVVDFRAKDRIFSKETSDSVPLLYPAHMNNGSVEWPVVDFRKKGQYYKLLTDQCQEQISGSSVYLDKCVLPADGCYVVVRRFSSKEERRRINAAVVDASKFDSSGLTFENHLNYFHVSKNGFDKQLAYGLMAYLNSEVLDSYFRSVSGHTQVNVTDLRYLPYPSKESLLEIGQRYADASGDIQKGCANHIWEVA
jgi:adenine-specific DNA-methyltransferase